MTNVMEEIELKFDVASQDVFIIIGPKYSTLRNIRSAFGVDIFIPYPYHSNEVDEWEERTTITIRGYFENVFAACKTIHASVAQGVARCELNFLLHKWKIANIIGKDGSNIRKVLQFCRGGRVELPRKDDRSSTVFVTGDRLSVESCYRAVWEFMQKSYKVTVAKAFPNTLAEIPIQSGDYSEGYSRRNLEEREMTSEPEQESEIEYQGNGNEDTVSVLNDSGDGIHWREEGQERPPLQRRYQEQRKHWEGDKDEEPVQGQKLFQYRFQWRGRGRGRFQRYPPREQQYHVQHLHQEQQEQQHEEQQEISMQYTEEQEEEFEGQEEQEVIPEQTNPSQCTETEVTDEGMTSSKSSPPPNQPELTPEHSVTFSTEQEHNPEAEQKPVNGEDSNPSASASTTENSDAADQETKKAAQRKQRRRANRREGHFMKKDN